MDIKILQDRLDQGELDCPMCKLSNDIGVLGIQSLRARLECRACGWKFSYVLKQEVC